jgi:hypothetical protein
MGLAVTTRRDDGLPVAVIIDSRYKVGLPTTEDSPAF